jgi:hypothetical protein
MSTRFDDLVMPAPSEYLQWFFDILLTKQTTIHFFSDPQTGKQLGVFEPHPEIMERLGNAFLGPAPVVATNGQDSPEFINLFFQNLWEMTGVKIEVAEQNLLWEVKGDKSAGLLKRLLQEVL